MIALVLKKLDQTKSETYSGPLETSKMEIIAIIVSDL